MQLCDHRDDRWGHVRCKTLSAYTSELSSPVWLANSSLLLRTIADCFWGSAAAVSLNIGLQGLVPTTGSLLELPTVGSLPRILWCPMLVWNQLVCSRWNLSNLRTVEQQTLKCPVMFSPSGTDVEHLWWWMHPSIAWVLGWEADSGSRLMILTACESLGFQAIRNLGKDHKTESVESWRLHLPYPCLSFILHPFLFLSSRDLILNLNFTNEFLLNIKFPFFILV